MRNVVKIPLIFTLLIVIYFLFATGFEETEQYQVKETQNPIIQDAIEQYNSIKRNGSSYKVSKHAGFVADAFLNAGDKKNYSKWKKIKEKEEEQEVKNTNIDLP